MMIVAVVEVQSAQVAKYCPARDEATKFQGPSHFQRISLLIVLAGVELPLPLYLSSVYLPRSLLEESC